jgi:DNA uptake protein ComE-like DNA-binding protein
MTISTMPQRRCGFNQRRRGFVLLAVLVIVGSALLVVTGLIYFAQSESAGRAVSRDRAQRSVMIHSALNIIIPQLDQQREAILRGEVPTLNLEYELHESDGRLAVMRLLPLREGGPVLEPEAGKLDLNAVSAEQLVATGLFDPSVAERIVRFRDEELGRPFQSIAELLRVDGVTPQMVYGSLDEIQVGGGGFGESVSEFSPFGRQPRFQGGSTPTAKDVLTVFAFEPALQRDGRLRINLNVEWSDELARRLDERFGQGASQIVKSIIDDGTTFDDESVIYSVLNRFDVPLEDWPNIVDALTTEAGEYHFSRLDINTASDDALRALPTIEPEQASEIVRLRESLADDEKATIAWPLLHGILDRQQYVELGGRITTRSWTYRIRITVGHVDAEEPDGPLQGAMICEAVIDLSAPKPRVAYLRDVTMLDLAARIAEGDGGGEGDGWDDRSVMNDMSRSGEGALLGDPALDEGWNNWPENDWEVGTLHPIGGERVNGETSGQNGLQEGGPTRRRIGRWRGG